MSGGEGRWLVITSSFPRHRRDLAGHFVRGWCQALVDCGQQVDVLCWRGPGAADYRISERLSVRFVPYAPPRAETLFFGAGAPENLAERPLRALLAVPAVGAMLSAAVQACRSTDYDGVVGHWLIPGGLVARATAAVTGLPSSVVGHSAGVQLLAGLPKPVAAPLGRWIVSAPTTVPTGPLQATLRQAVGRQRTANISVAPMGYEPAPPSQKPVGSDDALRLGFLGRLVPIKGLERVLQAVRRLRADGQNVRLQVVGDGPARGRWERLAGAGVEFCGPAFGHTKWAYLRSWDAAVIPSKRTETGRHEGLPVSLLEAASVGAIPLVSSVPGVHRWLAKPSRQVVDGHIDGWVEAIRWVASADHRLRRLTRRRVAAVAWPNYGPRWLEWLEQGGNILPRSAGENEVQQVTPRR